mgnify:FL=1
MSWLNHRTLVLHPDCESLRDFMLSVPERFDRGEGTIIHKGRNELRKMKYGEQEFVVKSFHRPNLINRFVYGIFRPSKAKRSYVHAGMFLEIGVGTPRPVGYINVRRGGLFDRSYYVTYVSPCPYTYEALFKQKFSYEDEVLSEVGRITGILHNHGYAHKDYGRGNILFLHTEQGVYLEVVDLNRLAVGPLDMKAGCKNLERLPATPHMHRVLAEAYAKERGLDPEACYRLMVAYRSTQPGKIDGLY